MLQFRNWPGLRLGGAPARVALGFSLALAGVLSASSSSDHVASAQSLAPSAESAGVAVAGSEIGYATSHQLMSIEAREAAAALTVRDGVLERRRIVRRPTLDSQDARLASNAVASETEIGASAPVTFSQAFVGATFGETGSLPPDPSGGAGPAQFILAANGRIRSFSKATGTLDQVLNLTTDAFFTPVRNGARTFGPKIKYDRLAGRWFIVAATDAVPGRILIASSNASTISASTLWSFFSFDNTGFPGAASCAVDSPTFGLDPWALYIGVVQFCDPGGVYVGTSGFVVRKTSVIDFATIAVTAFHNLTGSSTGAGPFAPHGVDNEDLGIGAGHFIGVNNAALGSLVVRRVSNPGGTPTISSNIVIGVQPTAAPITVRHLGNLGGANGYLDGGDDRLTSAMLQNGSLWTAQTIGVNESGAASATATRNGVRWYQITGLTGTPAVSQWGTLFTSGSAGNVNLRNYFVPSIATSTTGRTVIGYSAAGSNEYANAGVAERFSSDANGSLRAPQFFTTSNDAYNPPGDPGSATRGRRWGNASSTVVDGCDGSTIWTVQQFTDAPDSYALAVGRTVGLGVPTPTSVTPSTIPSGVASIDLQVTATSSGGTSFVDPGAGYLCRLYAYIPGLTINSVTRTGPTTATINVSTVNASPGLKAISVINPDSQMATSGAILRVRPGAMVTLESPAAGGVGQGFEARGWAVDGAATSGTGIDLVHVWAFPASGSPVFIGEATYGISRPDVAAAHGAQFGASGFSIRASSVLPAGAWIVRAYGHSTVTGAFSATAEVGVTISPPAPPFGAIDTPANNATVAGEVAVTGWALDDGGVAAVDIYRSPVGAESGLIYVGRAVSIRGARPDVQAAYPSVFDNDNAGWGFMVLTNMLPNQGNGTFDLHVFAVDFSGQSTNLGSRRIIAANAGSAKPFGTIDTPGQGQTVSGMMTNFGWALTPAGKNIPTNGSTIDVYIDGVYRGHPVYNNYRSDIANLFPGLANSNGAVGYFMFDTTTLSNGLHSISWVVTDSAGQTSGMGSRFFRVQNGS